MYRFTRTSTVLSVLLALSACAHKAEPIVDMRGVDPAQYREDVVECGAYADQVKVGQKAGAEAAGGAVVWGLIGAIFDDSDAAAKGAGAGAVHGGYRGTREGLRERKQVIGNCLRYRGYAVLN